MGQYETEIDLNGLAVEVGSESVDLNAGRKIVQLKNLSTVTADLAKNASVEQNVKEKIDGNLSTSSEDPFDPNPLIAKLNPVLSHENHSNKNQKVDLARKSWRWL